MEKPAIKVLNAALEERSNGDIILRGSIAIESLQHLRTDDYQREVLAPTGGSKSKLRRGVEAGVTLPDIELGMRGDNFSAHGKTVILHDPVFIVDGLQRVSAFLAHMADEGHENTNTNPLGAAIHFCTTKEWEKERFAALNQLRIPVSPNIILRNLRDRHPCILTLYGLSNNDKDFALYERVCWTQRMTKGELVSASTLMRAAIGLHRHVLSRMPQGRSAEGTVGQGRLTTSFPAQLDRAAKEIGLAAYRQNIKAFFELIDQCYGIRSIQYSEAQGHLRGNFITVLGMFLSKNKHLWKESDQKTLAVDTKTRTRLKAFPINDPEIRRLSSAGTMVIPTLYTYLLNHMNHRRSTHRFQ